MRDDCGVRMDDDPLGDLDDGLGRCGKVEGHFASEAVKVNEGKASIEIVEPPRYPDDPCSPYLRVDLPGGARLPRDNARRIWDRLLVREFMGGEEDLLVAQTDRVTKLNRMLCQVVVEMHCTETGDVEKDPAKIAKLYNYLTLQDQLWEMIQVRRLSFGDMFAYTIKCPTIMPNRKRCRGVVRGSMDLRYLQSAPMDREDVRAELITTTLKTGRVVEWEIRRVHHELKMIGYKDEDSMLSAAILVRVRKLDGKELKWGDESSLAAVSSGMRIRDRQELRKIFEEHERQLDIEDDFECEECGQKFKADLPVWSPDFFSVTELPEGLNIL